MKIYIDEVTYHKLLNWLNHNVEENSKIDLPIYEAKVTAFRQTIKKIKLLISEQQKINNSLIGKNKEK